MYIGAAVDSINEIYTLRYMFVGMYKNIKLCMCILLLHGGSCIIVLSLKGGGNRILTSNF